VHYFEIFGEEKMRKKICKNIMALQYASFSSSKEKCELDR